MIELRAMTAGDLPRVARWMREPHVARWWLAGSSAEAELRELHACLRAGTAAATHPLLVLAAVKPGDAPEPVGWCQWYPLDAYSAEARAVGARPGDCGVDYAIGTPAAVGRGLGTRLIAALVDVVHRHHPGCGIVADPDAENHASRRVLEKNGFALVAVRPVETEPTDRPLAIYRLRGAAPAPRPQLTIGIDLASQTPGTAICALEWRPDCAVVRMLSVGAHDGRPLDDAFLMDAMTGAASFPGADVVKVGIDAPFGWPDDFVAAVSAHHRPGRWPAGPDAPRADFFWRETDRWIRNHAGKTPLSVSTDRIGVVAMRCAGLLGELPGGSARRPSTAAGRASCARSIPTPPCAASAAGTSAASERGRRTRAATRAGRGASSSPSSASACRCAIRGTGSVSAPHRIMPSTRSLPHSSRVRWRSGSPSPPPTGSARVARDGSTCPRATSRRCSPGEPRAAPRRPPPPGAPARRPPARAGSVAADGP